MKKQIAILREEGRNVLLFFLPGIVSTSLLTIALKTLDALILSYYNALGYQFQLIDLLKAWAVDISLISRFWLVFLFLLLLCRNKCLKISKYIIVIFFVMYSFLSIFFSYYTAFSELLPDLLLFNYNGQNTSLLYTTYAYLLFPFFIYFSVALFFFWLCYRLIKRFPLRAVRFGFVFLFVFSLIPTRTLFLKNQPSEAKKVVYENKVSYFIKSLLFKDRNDEVKTFSDSDYKEIFDNEIVNKRLISAQFPLLRYRDTCDVLSPFFSSFDRKPNLVFIIIESLGRNYSGPDALYGSFTPFLDSLAQNSLYWYNFLATSGRTFGVLPSIFASVPYGEKGFNELCDSFPNHSSLLRNLKHNGYFISFFYGGWSNFDNMASFLEYNHADYIINVFPKRYKKMGNEQFSWGYDDRTLFNHSLNVLDSFPPKPRVDIYLTLSNHNPWNYSEIGKYEKKLDQYFAAHPELLAKQTTYYIKKRYATVLYTDDVLRHFFDAYKKRPEYENTIFIITGDHGLSYDINFALKKFHVPLIIYSPKLKRSAVFKGVCSHLDIAPSLEQMLKKKARLNIPSWTCYLGSYLDTSNIFRIKSLFSFIWENKTYPDVLMDNLYLNKDSLFTVSDNFVQKSIVNPTITEEMKHKRTSITSVHKMLPKQNKLLPISTFLSEYAIQVYPECKKQTRFEQCKLFKVNELKKENEFTTILSLKCKQNNNDGLLHVLGTIQYKLLSTESTTFKLVFEAKDSAEKSIGWQCFEFSVKNGETKTESLNKYFVLKKMNTFVPIRYINAYFWNNNKASIKIQKLDMKVYLE